MFTQWSQVESWIRDNGLNSWRFCYDKTGTNITADGEEKQTRSNRLAVLSDAFPGELEEKIALTKRRLIAENNVVLYGYGKRGKENTGQLYCEVRLVDELQQPGMAAPVSSVPSVPVFDEDKLAERIRKECMLEFENKQYQAEKKAFEQEKKAFQQEKESAIGMLVHYLAPVVSTLGQKRVAGVDATAPVVAEPVQPIHAEQEQIDEPVNELFTEDEADKLFDLMARFKQVEPRYMELIEQVVTMAESGDSTYEMAKKFLLK